MPSICPFQLDKPLPIEETSPRVSMSRMHSPTLRIGMLCYLELVSYSWHSFPLLYCNIYFTMKKKRRSREEYYLPSAAVVSPFNKRKNSWVHPSFGINMALGKWNHYLDSTPPTCYSSSPYGEFVDASCVTKFCQWSMLSLCCLIYSSVSCSC